VIAGVVSYMLLCWGGFVFLTEFTSPYEYPQFSLDCYHGFFVVKITAGTQAPEF